MKHLDGQEIYFESYKALLKEIEEKISGVIYYVHLPEDSILSKCPFSRSWSVDFVPFQSKSQQPFWVEI